MKRTLNEIKELIKLKIWNAANAKMTNPKDKEMQKILNAQIGAYEDVLSLLNSCQ